MVTAGPQSRTRPTGVPLRALVVLRRAFAAGASLAGTAVDALAVRGGDRRDTDVRRRRDLRANAGHADGVTGLDGVLAPSLPIQRVRRTTLDLSLLHICR